MLEKCGHEYVLARSKSIMNCAALLSDLFYPLAETVAVRRTRIPKYMRHEQTYGEVEGIIRVDENEGAIEFDMPRSVFLTAQRELGAYWGTLRVELPMADELSPDAPDIPSSEVWDLWQDDIKTRKEDAAEATQNSAEESEIVCLEDEPFPFRDRVITCVLRQPYPNQSAFTFASRKLQEVAESLEKEYRLYTERAVHAAKQFSHFELAESLADAWLARAKRDTSNGQTSGTPPSQELNPAANRARRASMLQQLRSLPGRLSNGDPLTAAADKPLGITPRSDGSAPPTPHRRASSTPSDDTLLNDAGQGAESSVEHAHLSVDSADPLGGTAPSRRQAEGERRPTAVFILPEGTEQPSPPPRDVDRTATAASPPPDTVTLPVSIASPPKDVDDVPEWLR